MVACSDVSGAAAETRVGGIIEGRNTEYTVTFREAIMVYAEVGLNCVTGGGLWVGLGYQRILLSYLEKYL